MAVLLCAWLAAGWSAVHAQDWAYVGELARRTAQTPFQPVSDTLPAELAQLNYDQMRRIRFRESQSTWRAEALPFEVQYFHLGNYQKQPVRIHETTDAGAWALPYRSALFDFDGLVADPSAWGDIGFAGFKLLHPLNTPDKRDELTAFLGASYFRALGAGQQYGLSARGLAIDTVGGQGEEFPRFTDFWLRRPASGASEVTVLALLDSPRVTGAYRFVIRPGQTTTMEVTARLFLRVGAAPVNTLGLAPLTSMFLHGDIQPNSHDFRPEVHDSDGLMMLTGDGEWLWRPLQNPDGLSVSSFAMRQPRGFGLMQRDRRFASYEDIEARYERRPSAWVRPLGDWGPGRVELVQLHTPDETHDNIVAYWVPATLPVPGEPLDIAYELSWQGDTPQTPPGAWVVQTRRGYGYTKLPFNEQVRQPQFVLDFSGPALDSLPADAPVRVVATADTNGRIVEALAYRNPEQRGWRATLRIERQDISRPVELRAFLQHQNHSLSETWTHVILPE